MGFIIFVAVVILAIYLIKKSSSDKNSSFEDLNDRDEIFRDLMQGRNTRCLASQGKLFKLNDLM